MMRTIVSMLTIFSCALILNGQFADEAAAQAGAGIYAYPKKGQSPEQQRRDKFECHEWAVRETGYDPQNPSPAPSTNYSSPPPRSSGSFLGLGEGGMFGEDSGLLGDAATGAALGAAGGAIAGDAGQGAAIGALASALIGGISRSSRHSEEEQWRQQQRTEAQQRHRDHSQQQTQQLENYKRAYSVCMTSRNYNVR